MDDMEKIRHVDLLLLEEFDRICREAGVSYFLFAGTLLGAVREHDFIPWDDDADVGMFRADYEKLIRAIEEKKVAVGEGFTFSIPQQLGKGFYDMIPKLSYDKSRLHDITEQDEYYEYVNVRISLDVYLLDFAPKSGVLFHWQVFRLKMLYGMMMNYRYQQDLRKYTTLEWMQVITLTTMGRLSSLPKLRKQYEKLAMKYDPKKENQDIPLYCFASNSIMQKLGVRFESKWLTQTVSGEIADGHFPIPIGAEEALTARYGDYRTPRKENYGIEHAKKNQVWAEVNGTEL